jgi:RNA polymerase sigma-70 factor (ECF subfamily)
VSKPVPSAVGLADFDAIYDRELDYVFRTLGRLGVTPADVPDAVHDVFVVLYKQWNEVDRERSVRPFLFGIARRVAAGRRRKRREILDPEAEPAANAGEAELIARRDLLWRALAEVPDDRREVIILHDLEGHTGASIAEMLGIPVNTVHSKLRLGRAQLLEALQRLGGTP